MKTIALVVLVLALASPGRAGADEAPISGTVKAVDALANTVTVESTVKGKTRTVVIHVTPGAKIVKFRRTTESGASGFVEQPLALAEIKAGWIVSAEAKHEGDREVASAIRVVLER